MATKTKRDPNPKVLKAARDGGLSPLELHALMIAGKAAAKVRDNLAAGAGQAVDVTLRLSGAVSVAEVSRAAVAETPKLATVLALAFGALDPSARLQVVRQIVEACRAFAATGDSEPEPEPAMVAEVQELLATIAHARVQERRGAVSGAIGVEVVSRGRRKVN